MNWKSFFKRMPELINSQTDNYSAKLFSLDGVEFIHTTRYLPSFSLSVDLTDGIYILIPEGEDRDMLLELVLNHESLMEIFDDIDVVHSSYGYINAFHGFEGLPDEVIELIPSEGCEQIIYYTITDNAS